MVVRVSIIDKSSGFLPGSGRLVHLSTPQQSEHVRVDTGVRQGDEVTVYYDPMIAKLVTWDKNRDEALKRLRNALDDYRVVGLATNIPFLKRVADHEAFIRADVSTAFIEVCSFQSFHFHFISFANLWFLI
jgi:3-methylcrotonyl-CoA carboxylase alpha subunit